MNPFFCARGLSELIHLSGSRVDQLCQQNRFFAEPQALFIFPLLSLLDLTTEKYTTPFSFSSLFVYFLFFLQFLSCLSKWISIATSCLSIFLSSWLDFPFFFNRYENCIEVMIYLLRTSRYKNGNWLSDRSFHHFESLKPVDRPTLCSLKTPID